MDLEREQAPLIPGDDPSLTEPLPATNQATAGKAKALLCRESEAFHDPSALERSAIAAAFAARNFVVYGKAFDLIELGSLNVDLSDPVAVGRQSTEGFSR